MVSFYHLSMSYLSVAIILAMIVLVRSEDPYVFLTFNVTYGPISPLGVKQQGILINGKFPGPEIKLVTNDNIFVNVVNHLDVPFLLTWNGLFQRKNSWEDGVGGTNCPILPNKSFTYMMQVKDQIGSYFYFPSLGMQKAAGGYGGITVSSRPLIPVPFPSPDGEITILIGDWFLYSHKKLKSILDAGSRFSQPNGLVINGHQSGVKFDVVRGKTYRLRISNVGIESSLTFSIQAHNLTLVEVEGTHTIQKIYESLNIHVGQSYSVLITADQESRDYFIGISTCFSPFNLSAVASLHYTDSKIPLNGKYNFPSTDISAAMKQFRSIRTLLNSSGPRPNVQGSYHYGAVTVNRTIVLEGVGGFLGRKQRYAVNGVSYKISETPAKLADKYNISGVYTLNNIPTHPPTSHNLSLLTSVMGALHRIFVEIVIVNQGTEIQSWHLDGYSFFAVGMGEGSWDTDKRMYYNLKDAIARSTIEVHGKSWAAIRVALDNVGMWNLRNQNWVHSYLGQQFYLKVYTLEKTISARDEYAIPSNAILCGKAKDLKL